MYFLPLILLIITLIFPSSVIAVEKFQVSHDVTYNVLENGNTKVTQNLHIKNQTTESLAKEFVFKIKNFRVSNIRAFDTSGALTVDAYQVPGGVEARVQFGKLTPGVDKIHNWTLTFETPGLARKVGRIWKVSLPPIAKTSNNDYVAVNLQVPKSLGSLLLAKPRPTESQNIWTGKDASGQIIAVFGTPNEQAYQAYDFHLKYYLENKSPFNSKMKIALPPDTSYQKVFLDKLDPKPENITLDADGNWLGEYDLAGKEAVSITATGSIAVFSSPQQKIISGFNPDPYLQGQPNWEVGHKDVVEAANSLKSTEDIYNSTVKNLTYDKTKVVKNPIRLGAVKAINNPKSAICTEFTDVFITLARTLQIPAREIDGFAYTEDQNSFPSSLGADVLHAWPEYFDQKENIWKMVDPTWGKTSGGLDYFHSFDFDHVALAIRGLKSDSPNPAGFYKKNNKLKKYITEEKPKKDVFITPVDKNLPLEKEPKLKFTKRERRVFFGLIPAGFELLVANNARMQSPAKEIIFEGKLIKLPAIPPLGHNTILLDN